MITRDSVIAALSHHRGRDQGATARVLVMEIEGRWSAGAERELRACVEALRTEGMPICALPGAGYHLPRDVDELDATIRFLTDRLATSARQVRALRRLARPGLGGQRRLML